MKTVQLFDIPVKFLERTIPVTESGCWLWTGALSIGGYGRVRFNKRDQYAHRALHEHFFGEIPAGYELDHLCRVRCCVNPSHLEVVTHSENMWRGQSPTRFNFEKMHCPSGHKYSGWNLYVDRLGHRHCKICKRESLRRFYARAREKRRATNGRK